MATLPGMEINWEPRAEPGHVLGTAHLGSRRQPFALTLRSVDARPVVRCISPIGNIGLGDEQDGGRKL